MCQAERLLSYGGWDGSCRYQHREKRAKFQRREGFTQSSRRLPKYALEATEFLYRGQKNSAVGRVHKLWLAEWRGYSSPLDWSHPATVTSEF
jgi:hypothetical protein